MAFWPRMSLDPAATPLPASDAARDLDAVREVAAARRALVTEIGKRIVGQEQVIEQLLVALFARGHCLFVGVPGLAKTLLIQTLADALALSFGRIQFTPDLMPADITGTDVLEEDRASGRRVFRFVRGPIFAQRRAGRRDQPHAAQDAGGAAAVDAGVPRHGGRADLRAAAAVSGLRHAKPDRAGGDLPAARGAARSLHVPDRRRLPVGGRGDPDRQPGDHRLPAARCARCCRRSGSSSCRSWCCACRRRRTWWRTPWPSAAPAAPTEPGAPELIKKYVSWGAGPRASQYLVLAAKARAILDGRYAASIDDVRALAGPVLVHRVVPNFHAEADGLTRAQARRAPHRIGHAGVRDAAGRCRRWRSIRWTSRCSHR